MPECITNVSIKILLKFLLDLDQAYIETKSGTRIFFCGQNGNMVILIHKKLNIYTRVFSAIICFLTNYFYVFIIIIIRGRWKLER